MLEKKFNQNYKKNKKEKKEKRYKNVKMSVLNAVAQQNLANSSIQAGSAMANSSFLEKNGHVVAVLLSMTYISFALYMMKNVLSKKVENEDDKKMTYMILSGLGAVIMFGVFIIGYYVKHKDDDDQKTARSTVGNISLIPVYIIIAIIVIAVMLSLR
jgi:hypothetical protein